MRAEKWEKRSNELQERVNSMQTELNCVYSKLHEQKKKSMALKAKLADVERVHFVELATAQKGYERDRVDSSSQVSGDEPRRDNREGQLQQELETLAEVAKAKIAKLRQERNEAKAIIQNMSTVQQTALDKIAELEAALQNLQRDSKRPRSPRAKPRRSHEVRRRHSPREPGNHAVLAELRSLSKGVKALEKRNARLTSLVGNDHSLFQLSDLRLPSDPWLLQSDSS
jgi:hypothetical protein